MFIEGPALLLSAIFGLMAYAWFAANPLILALAFFVVTAIIVCAGVGGLSLARHAKRRWQSRKVPA